jgi:hypothetical protein
MIPADFSSGLHWREGFAETGDEGPVVWTVEAPKNLTKKQKLDWLFGIPLEFKLRSRIPPDKIRSDPNSRIVPGYLTHHHILHIFGSLWHQS